MANWEDKANEVQSLLDKGYTNAELAKHFNVAIKTIKNRLPELERQGLIKRPKDRVKVQQDAKGKHTLERNKDGTYTSVRDKLWLRNDMIYNDEYILEQHGFNPKDWEIVTVRHNQWENYSKKDGITELFASKVTVKPRTQGWSFDDLLKAIREDIQPVHIDTEPAYISDQRMLEIPFYDMHFGVSDYDHYKRTQRDTYDILNSKRWEETLFIVGQDLLHNNDFSGKTANGTQIEVVDLPKAWKEARLFYITLIETAIRQSNHVKIVYSRGNHDEAMSWAFVQMLMERYPQIEFEDSLEDRKVHTFGRIFLGITHGDEARKDLEGIFPQEFPLEWAQTTYRELHQGHLHREEAIDHFGLMSRTLSTRNKTDKWHKRKGFVTAQKRFMLFEYTTDELKHIHYV